jgi:TatD DNase family protein
MKLVDSHAHLDLLDEPLEALKRAADAEVAFIICIGTDLKSTLAAADYSRRFPNVFPTVGLHPHEASQISNELFNEYKRLALTTPAVAVGECGLDFYRNKSPRYLQEEAFQRQVEMALDLGLPLVIHQREAHDPVMAILRDQGAERVGGVVHCFSGNTKQAKEVLDLGFCLGIPGTVTFKNNQQLRDVVKATPLKRMLLETDCPYLAPVPYRGKPNEPSYIVHTLNMVAEVLGLPPEEVAAQTSDNARRLYGLPLMEK